MQLDNPFPLEVKTLYLYRHDCSICGSNGNNRGGLKEGDNWKFQRANIYWAIWLDGNGTETTVDVKHEYDETIYGKVNICFDDVHACELAEKNIIVKMK